MPPSTSPGYTGARSSHSKKRKEREPAPEVPAPALAPPTSVRRDTFGTPTRSARVKKTYAHKRARPYSSSAAEDGPGSDVPAERASHSTTPDSSPTRPPVKATYGPMKGKTPFRSTGFARKRVPQNDVDIVPSVEANDRDEALVYDAGPTTFTASQKAQVNQNAALLRKRTTVYVEIPHRPKPTFRDAIQSKSRNDASRENEETVRVVPPRGRPPKRKPIAIPSPPPTSEDSSNNTRPTTRQQVSPKPILSLSEALNRSYQGASLPTVTSDTPINDPPTVPPKRGRGRRPGRGRARAALGPVISHGKFSSIQRTREILADSSQNADPGPSVPVKRGPGRPRKHPLPLSSGPSASTSRPPKVAERSRSRTRRRASGRDEDAEEAAAVAEQLLHESSHSPDRPSASSARTLGQLDNAYESVDVSSVARALERQAADETGIVTDADAAPAPAPTPKRGRGRPRGSKNKSTLAREAEARARGLAFLSKASPARVPVVQIAAAARRPALAPAHVAAAAPPPVLTPLPIKRGPGRPRKSAPSALPPLGAMEYFEPLKDPESDAPRAGPSTPRPHAKARTHARRNSMSAVPDTAPATAVAPSAYYLDLNTLQWKRRSQSVSASPKKRAPPPIDDADAQEYQTCRVLCRSLEATLIFASAKARLRKASAPGKGKGKGKGKEQAASTTQDGLRVAQSGVLLFADVSDGEDGEEDRTCVFKGSWSVVGDPQIAVDDALALKTLHEVMRDTSGYIQSEKARFTRRADGKKVTVIVPCWCQSVRHGAHAGSSREVQSECTGEMAVSVTEERAPRALAGIMRPLRMSVVVTH